MYTPITEWGVLVFFSKRYNEIVRPGMDSALQRRPERGSFLQCGTPNLLQAKAIAYPTKNLRKQACKTNNAEHSAAMLSAGQRGSTLARKTIAGFLRFFFTPEKSVAAAP